jgi:hypothetical protein
MLSKKLIMPDKLSSKDIEKIVYVFTKMSGSAKNDFLSQLIIDHPDHFKRIIKNITKKKINGIAQA